MLSFDQIATEIRHLFIAQRKQLVAVILDTLTEDNPPKTHSILEFEGIGERLYDGTDAQDYVNRLRDEWDERP